jgi:hypothetical protein
MRPCLPAAPVVRAVGASRSTSVAPDLDAIAAGSLAGQRGVLGGQPEKPAQSGKNRSIRGPQGRTRHLSAQDGNFVAEHYDLDGQVLLPTT